MSRFIAAAALSVSTCVNAAAANSISVHVSDLRFETRDLNPHDNHVPTDQATWITFSHAALYNVEPFQFGDHKRAEQTGWGDTALGSQRQFPHGSASASASFINGVGEMRAEGMLDHHDVEYVQMNASAARSVELPTPFNDLQRVFHLAPYSSVTISGNFRIDYDFNTLCNAAGGCPFALATFGMSALQRGMEPWEPYFNETLVHRTTLDGRDFEFGRQFTWYDQGTLSITIENKTGNVQYGIFSVGVGVGLGYIAPVPEPATGLLVVAGLATIASTRRRRRNDA